MELIRLKVMLALRRANNLKLVNEGVHQACFQIDWDAVNFLKAQYSDSVLQPLRQILAITGDALDAQITTVEQYLLQTWPQKPYFLVDALTSTLSGDKKKPPCELRPYPTDL